MAKLVVYPTGLGLWILRTVLLAFSGPGQNLNAQGSPPSFEAELLRTLVTVTYSKTLLVSSDRSMSIGIPR
jgi:hypothetical protein